MKTISTTLKPVGLAILAWHSAMAGEAPSFAWVQSGGGISVDYAVAAAIDEAGNSFLGARVQSSAATLGGLSLTNPCVIVAKFNAAGTPQWSVGLRPAANVRNLQLGTDQAGNCYAAGHLFGPIAMGSSNLTIAPANSDLFLAKFSPEGNLLWARVAGSGSATNQIFEPSLFVERNGECLLAGSYRGEIAIGTNQLGFPGAFSRPFVARATSTGDWLWSRDPCATTNESLLVPTCVVGRPDGDYYLGGYFGTVVQFGNQTFTNPPSTTFPPEPKDFFLIKCNQNGNVLWAKSVPDCAPLSLATDSSGYCYLLGARFGTYFGGSISFDGCVLTNTAMFLLKLDPLGNVLWCRNPADLGYEQLLIPGGTWRLAIDAAEQLYVAGYFYGTAVLGSLTITNRGGTLSTPGYFPSSFLAKYDTAGTAIWAKPFGGGFLDYPFPLDYPYDKTALAVNAEGRCAVVGAITITNALFDDTLLATTGGEDAFIAQLNPEPPSLGTIRNGAEVVIFWPTNQPGFALERNVALTAGDWFPATNSIVSAGIHHFVTNPIAGDSQYFRLRKP